MGKISELCYAFKETADKIYDYLLTKLRLNGFNIIFQITKTQDKSQLISI